MKVYLGDADNLMLLDAGYKRALVNFWLDDASTFEFYRGKDIICDSGAFSFMMDPRRLGRTNIDEYCDRYCENINRYDIRHFLEMDVDTLLGVEKALELRKRIESKAKHAPIPVWHRERGKQGWEEMCDNYDYVALPLSGKNDTSRWLRQEDYKRLWWFVEEAHKRGARIHALGMGGNCKLYQKGAFFSCDSVTWTYVARTRSYVVFNPREVRWEKHVYESENRVRHKKARLESVRQWTNFAQWAEVNL